MQSMTITAVQPKDAYGQWDDVWKHTYNVTLNPCDGSFTGTGQAIGTGYPGIYTNETITGNFDGTTVSYLAKYVAPSERSASYAVNGPISKSLIATAWNADGTKVDTAPNVLEFNVSQTMTPLAPVKNHGDFVSQSPDKNDAAHSCIGMPIK